ncbi:hypothetical protein RvY_15549 [Ramazzottius varieornatus]|uniref:Tartrate-resistant acid phosphatase type 5 n=1 Tax=Ramazzottius varieornatus TaxID=947166 RepID=A0A1D1W397_RAMVA|nr:hypothetical protein RvY_15549 [Ramazzottius varieornatus]
MAVIQRVFITLAFFVIIGTSLGVILKHNHSDGRDGRKGRKSNDGLLSFLVLGDWGGLPVTPYHTAVELSIARQMGLTADAVDAKFTLALGDNFYFDGVKDVNDRRFERTYETVFQATSLDTPWYLIAGNHDHNGNVSAQIAYSDKLNRWKFPDYYYNLKFECPSGATVEIVLIDTVLLCGHSDHDFLHKQPEPWATSSEIRTAEDQWAWIEKTLKASRAEYLLVGGHYPVYSVAEHGSTKCLVDRLFPLLHKYKVQAYLSGHDHNLQHIQTSAKNWTTEYLVVGAANFIEDSQIHLSTIPKGSLKYYWADTLKLGGFGVFQVDRDVMTFRFVDAQTGQALHGLSIEPLSDR